MASHSIMLKPYKMDSIVEILGADIAGCAGFGSRQTTTAVQATFAQITLYSQVIHPVPSVPKSKPRTSPRHKIVLSITTSQSLSAHPRTSSTSPLNPKLV